MRASAPDLPRWLHAFCDRLLKINPSHRFASAKEALRALDSKHVPRPPLNRRLVFALAALLVIVGAAAAYFWRHPLPLSQIIAPIEPGAAARRRAAFHDRARRCRSVALARAIEEHAREWLRGDARLAVASRARVRAAMARTAPDLQGDALVRQLPDIARAANANRVLRGSVKRGNDGWTLELSWAEPGRAAEPTGIVARGKDAAALFTAYQASLSNALASVDVHAGAPPALAAASARCVRPRPDRARQPQVRRRGHGARVLEQRRAARCARRDALLTAQEGARQDLPAQNTRDDATKRFATDPSPVARELVARALSGNGDADKAITALADAVKAYPHDPSFTLLYADTLDEAGDGAKAITVLHDAVDADDEDARAWFLLGRTAIRQAQAGRGVDDYLLHALVLNVRSGDAAAEAETRNAMGVGYEHVGKLDAAAEAYGAAATIQEKLGDPRALAKSLRNLAIVEAVMGNRDAAEKTLDRVKGLLESIGDQASIADLHNDRGVVAEERGDFAAAIAAYKEALAIRRRLDDPALIAESLDNIGFSAYQLGNFDDALVYWQQALDLYRKVDDRRGTLHVEQSIGLLDIAQGHFPAAQERLQASVQKAEDAQLPEEVAAAQITLADLYLLEGRYSDAAAAADRAQQFFSRRSDERGEVESNLSKARIALALGDADGVDKALAAISPDRANSEQRGVYLLLVARRASLAGDAAAASAKLDAAAKSADASHSARSIFVSSSKRRARRWRAAIGLAPRACSPRSERERRSSARCRSDSNGWSCDIAAALRAGNKSEAANRYREALALLKEPGRYANAAVLHELGVRALPDGGAEQTAARAAAEAARKQLLADAPPDAKASLDKQIDQRLQQDVGDAR